MSQRLVRTAALILLGVLLVTLPGLAGCAGEEGKVPEIVIGVLSDYTGPAAYACTQLIDTFQDYFRMVEEEDPIPGVNIRFVTYDMRTDYSRVPPGYVWLKTKGAMLMAIIHPTSAQMLAPRAEEDQIPLVGGGVAIDLCINEWVFSMYATNEVQIEAILMWITDTWDYDGKGRNPKVGHVGYSGYTTTAGYDTGIAAFLEAHPGEIDYVGTEAPPTGTTSWAGEVSKLKDCDYIVMTCVGPGVPSFIKEARARGYTGAFLSGTEAIPGFMKSIRTAVSSDQLYGLYHMGYWPWWNDDVPYINDLKEAIQEYHSDEAEELLKESGPLTGWGFGMYVAEAIRRAVEEVGAENVDGAAIRDALAETNMTVQGFGNTWSFTETNHCCCLAQRAYEYLPEEDDWVAVSDWIMPASLAGS
jgi:ABC-type branched-subunit amino acid transport system substrate-binding protein